MQINNFPQVETAHYEHKGKLSLVQTTQVKHQVPVHIAKLLNIVTE